MIISAGSTKVDFLFESLKGAVGEIYTIGDAKEPGNFGAALRSATEIGLAI